VPPFVAGSTWEVPHCGRLTVGCTWSTCTPKMNKRDAEASPLAGPTPEKPKKPKKVRIAEDADAGAWGEQRGGDRIFSVALRERETR
jgi:hypothetical protein